eukprot:snap_masked-scaffold_17-processed-gene-6.34-mRNA-1 protein AED:1.00 eAED:1.00 QI:0/0/0/0/1/1/2/0/181
MRRVGNQGNLFEDTVRFVKCRASCMSKGETLEICFGYTITDKPTVQHINFQEHLGKLTKIYQGWLQIGTTLDLSRYQLMETEDFFKVVPGLKDHELIHLSVIMSVGTLALVKVAAELKVTHVLCIKYFVTTLGLDSTGLLGEGFLHSRINLRKAPFNLFDPEEARETYLQSLLHNHQQEYQ